MTDDLRHGDGTDPRGDAGVDAADQADAGDPGRVRDWDDLVRRAGLADGTDIAGPQDRTDIDLLRGSQHDAATGGSDLGPTTGGGDTGAV
jgi:hypothetical protein